MQHLCKSWFLLQIFNVYFSVVKFRLSSHIWLFRLVSSQLISQLIDARCRQRAWQPQRAVQPRHVALYAPVQTSTRVRESLQEPSMRANTRTRTRLSGVSEKRSSLPVS
ncbi:hypothetical protein EYF80_055475 [Liparis tanakae]|uniref:Uncharacterized protein n=1 Tax=Liparis tanakae TaxID=230148 RepID=A0A4Z2F1L8_9TELE|nr:hypothetical protein EYF80_055475 [Liparis tanakae]